MPGKMSILISPGTALHCQDMKVLVIDVGGSHVKVRSNDPPLSEKFDSGPNFGPQRLASEVRRFMANRPFDSVTIGYPGLVKDAKPAAEPGNLGGGWIGFDFEKEFRMPVRFIHDAALQALGGYHGGRMLFLGLGTGLGSAMIMDRVVIPLELGDIVHPSGQLLSERMGKDGLAKNGRPVWQQDVTDTTNMLREALAVDYVLLGGGNAELVDPLPPKTVRGGNEDALVGGCRLWEETVGPHDRQPSSVWRVL
jgi:polyphosphate glucokinase